MKNRLINKIFIGLFTSALILSTLSACSSGNDGESTDTTEKIITEESSVTTDIQNENEDVVEESIEEVELPRMNSYTADDNGYCASFDVVKFGSYEQDGNKDNGSEAIEWYVIAKEDGKALLLSKYILANTMYNFEMDNGKAVAVDTTWETSWLRQWLNFDFYNNAFLEEEQEHIIQTQLVNSLNDDTGVVIGGNETIDSVFVLSEDEINKYFIEQVP